MLHLIFTHNLLYFSTGRWQLLEGQVWPWGCQASQGSQENWKENCQDGNLKEEETQRLRLAQIGWYFFVWWRGNSLIFLTPLLLFYWHSILSGGYGEQPGGWRRGNYNLLRLRAFAKAKNPKGDPESKIFTSSSLPRSSIYFEATTAWEPEANSGHSRRRTLLRLTWCNQEASIRGYLRFTFCFSFGGSNSPTSQFIWLQLSGCFSVFRRVDAIKHAGFENSSRVMQPFLL